MSDNNMRAPLLICLALLSGILLTKPAVAGEPHDSTYALVAYVGGGFSYYAVPPGSPPGIPTDVSRSGLAGTVRVMWHPDHLLRLGFETGWTKFYSYTLNQTPSGHLYLSAVPLIVVWSMSFFGVDVFAGTGYYLLNSNLEYQGTVNVQTWSLGFMAAASYTHRLSDNLGVAGELKWMNATEHEDASLTLQVQLVWKFFEW